MTDAAVPVTQSTVERFTERYLRSIGCSIKRSENHWVVTVPNGTETDLSIGNHTLACGKDSDQVDNAEPLNPESEFFQRILREAVERSPAGKLSIGGETDVELPGWIQNSAVEVRNAQFTPYYDRTAAVFLFRIGIETVSEYQQEFLRAVAVDVRSEEHLPKLEDTFLEMTSIYTETDTGDRSHFTETDVQLLLNTARDQLLDGIEEQIDEIHREASRAADAEVEEYRQMQQQRIQELEEEHSNLSSRIDELSEAINTGDPNARVLALRERKEFKSECDEIGTTLNELRERRDKGFPEQQREIRKRHSLNVQVTPLTVTEVEYERGELDLELAEGKIKRVVTIGYGAGIGTTDTVRCSLCDQELTERNPLHTIEEGLRCMECTDTVMG